MTIVSCKEILEQAAAEEAKLLTKDGVDGVSFDGDTITLDGWYHIGVERVNSNEKLLSWLAHLIAKNWVTRRQLYWFVKVSSEHNGLTPYLDI